MSMKYLGAIGLWTKNNRLFGTDRALDLDPGSVFPFSQHLEIA